MVLLILADIMQSSVACDITILSEHPFQRYVHYILVIMFLVFDLNSWTYNKRTIIYASLLTRIYAFFSWILPKRISVVRILVKTPLINHFNKNIIHSKSKVQRSKPKIALAIDENEFLPWNFSESFFNIYSNRWLDSNYYLNL